MRTNAVARRRRRRDPLTAENCSSSWWTTISAYYHEATGRVLLGGTGQAAGDLYLHELDRAARRIKSVRLVASFGADDHNTPALSAPAGAIPLVALAQHGGTDYINLWVGAGVDKFLPLGPRVQLSPGGGLTDTSYGTILRVPGSATDFLLIYRGTVAGTTGTYYSRCTISGQSITQTAGPFRLHSREYNHFRQVGNTVHVATSNRPTDTVPEVRYWKLDLSTGVVSKADGTVIGQGGATIYNQTGTSGLIAVTDMGLVQTGNAATSQRPLDIDTKGNRVAMIVFTRSGATADNIASGVLVVRRRSASGATSWVTEEVCPAGDLLGYEPSYYWPGACFEVGGDALIVCRRPLDQPGVAVIERYQRDPGATEFGTATWTKTDTIERRTDGRFHGRPKIPLSELANAPAALLVHDEYDSYSRTDFNSDYGRRKLRRYATTAPGPGAPTNTVAPAITGTAAVGQTLTGSTGTWTSDGTLGTVTYAYQWTRDSGDGLESFIAGATTNTYTLVDADEAQLIRVRVTATNTAGSRAAESAPTSGIAGFVPAGSLQDTFTEASPPVSLQSHTADSGHTWAVVAGATQPIAVNSAGRIRGGTSATAANDFAIYRSSWTPPSADYEAYAYNVNLSSSTGLRIGVRVQATGDGYYGYWDRSNHLYKIIKRVSGVETTVASVADDGTNTARLVSLRATGTRLSLKVYVGTTYGQLAEVLAFDDSTGGTPNADAILTAGRPGVYSPPNQFSDTTRVQFDYFVARS